MAYEKNKRLGSGRKLIAGLLTSGALLWPTLGHAQDAGDAAQASEHHGIQDIVVTARRQEERLQTTPLAITALGESELQAKNVSSLLDVGSIAPNVLVGSQSTTGAQNGGFFIRGFGQDRSGITFDQAVGLYVDDVFYSRSDNTLINIVDVERIEVLRGPQGTLYGKNTIGGAIRYISRKPGPDFGGYVDATVGSFDRLDLKAVVNVPLSDNVFAKATFGSLERDGFIKHVIDNKRDGDENTRVGRLELRFLAGDNVTIDLEANKIRTRTRGRGFIIDKISPNALFSRTTQTKLGIVYDDTYLSPDNRTLYGGTDTGYDYDGHGLSGVVTVDLSDTISLKSVTAYLHANVLIDSDWDGTPIPLYDISYDRKIEQFSQELQLSGTLFDDRLKFVSGLYYMQETPSDKRVQSTTFDSQFPIPRLLIDNHKVDSYAAFFQGTYKWTDKLSTTLGLRYSKDTKSGRARNLTPRPDGTPYPNGILEGRDKQSWDNFSPRISVEYQWSPDVMTYASWARGFRSGGFNENLLSTEPGTGLSYRGRIQPFLAYDPETVDTYEIGIRSDPLDILRFNLTGFYSKYRDQQLSAFDAAQNITYIQNVGKSVFKGFELESTLAVTDWLRVQGTLGYLDAQYKSIGAAQGLTTNSRVLRAPKWNYTIGAQLRQPVGDGEVVANIDYNYRSTQGTTSSDGNTVILDPYGLLTARIQYNAPDNKWSIAAFATNLADKDYFIGGIDFATPNTIGMRQMDVGRPREFGINLRYNF
ncbi:MAG: TonB-dependent receptor [Sphingopyxis sp.]|uniref:TonB-dependent receptor n=1 Tax=Sphingopyxis sp. TaxID=1908224 RepID=UPI002AB8462D|nr:TonB-dependent receptor [Sphingopyxis sp.]MDZ3832847.1 TonB-dependent receptor [Sphingopyxis sp.]